MWRSSCRSKNSANQGQSLLVLNGYAPLHRPPFPLVLTDGGEGVTVASISFCLLFGLVLSWIPGVSETWWAVLTSIPPVAALLACAVIMVRKLNRYERWVPWMGVFWLPLVPFTMVWLIITIGKLAV